MGTGASNEMRKKIRIGSSVNTFCMLHTTPKIWKKIGNRTGSVSRPLRIALVRSSTITFCVLPLHIHRWYNKATVADLRGGARDAPSGPKFLHFHTVFGKKLPNNRLTPPLLGLAPLLWEILHRPLDYLNFIPKCLSSPPDSHVLCTVK